jgi:hypothetical protein
MKNFLLSIFGVGFCISLGVVIGFWLQVLLSTDLPNGFYECKDCGVMSFAELERYWRRK